MLSFQRNSGCGTVNSADDKHLSADTNVVGITKYLITNFCKNRNCVAVCVRLLTYNGLRNASGHNIYFVRQIDISLFSHTQDTVYRKDDLSLLRMSGQGGLHKWHDNGSQVQLACKKAMAQPWRGHLIYGARGWNTNNKYD